MGNGEPDARFSRRGLAAEMILRDYTPGDCKTLTELFFNTVHTINARDYSEEQLNAWATGSVDIAEWNRSFLSNYTVVAEIGGSVVGFGDIDDTGYLVRLYVHADFQRQGIAAASDATWDFAHKLPDGAIAAIRK